MFEQRMKDNYIQEWNSKVRSTSDYRLYKKIKFTFNFENYLNMDNKSFRISITKIRLSSHLFYIERGRWGPNAIDFNETTFLRMFEQRMKDTYIQEWNSKVRSTSDYRLYKKIKFTFNFENYLNMDNKSFRISITKIRLSSHLFYIERGRWEKQKIEAIDRKCVFCNTIEDEYHCLIECPRFKDVRKKCLPIDLIRKPSMFHFVNFIQCLDKSSFNKVGLLCYKVMKDYKTHFLLD